MMPGAAEYLACVLVIGVGATALLDLWSIGRRTLFGVPAPDYALVGRWLAHMPRGRFRHDSIAASSPVHHEGLIGWTAHYAIGVVFAAVLPVLWGTGWICRPTIGPAMIVGIGSVVAPFLLMQPGMGAGIAASRTPRPAVARVRSFANHAIFGLGLYGAAWLVSVAAAPCSRDLSRMLPA
jgi:hypothetical protein